MTKPLYHANPSCKCDVCRKPTPKRFIDGATKMGPWADMCEACHRQYGRGLGVGKGQLYEKQENGKFLCIEGRGELDPYHVE